MSGQGKVLRSAMIAFGLVLISANIYLTIKVYSLPTITINLAGHEGNPKESLQELEKVLSSAQLLNYAEQQRTFFIGMLTILALLVTFVGAFSYFDRMSANETEQQLKKTAEEMESMKRSLQRELNHARAYMEILESGNPAVELTLKDGSVVSDLDGMQNYIEEDLPGFISKTGGLDPAERNRFLFNYLSILLRRTMEGGLAEPGSAIEKSSVYKTFFRVMKRHLDQSELDAVTKTADEYFKQFVGPRESSTEQSTET